MAGDVPPTDPITLGGPGDIDMYPSQAFEAARTVYQAGEAQRQAWEADSANIRHAENQLGKGPLGKAFRDDYNAFEKELTPAVKGAEGELRALGSAGADSVVIYLRVDGQDVPALFKSLL